MFAVLSDIERVFEMNLDSPIILLTYSGSVIEKPKITFTLKIGLKMMN